jgi:hypothetical protein
VAANHVPTGAALQLVSPLAGVESVVAAVTSAGGADSASADETLRHAPARLWARDRAVSGRDIEQLALAYAPEIVQARCIAGRRGGAAARLVIAVSGENPRPSRPVRRELQRYLLERATPSLTEGRHFRVDAPTIRRCRMTIGLTIESLDRGGSIEQAAHDAIHAFLHWATGGLDGRGWPLGSAPAEDDLAAVLTDVPGVIGIRKIDLSDADVSSDAPFPLRIAEDVLVMIAPTNGITIDMEEGKS